MRLGELMAKAFIEIRAIGLEGRAAQASDLADALHNIPREIHGWGCWSKHITRGMLQSYQDRYHGENYSPRFDYVAAFDNIFAA